MKKLVAGVCGLILLMAGLAAGCSNPSTTTTTTATVYTRPALVYLLLDEYADYFWCDPYEYPIGRPEQERLDALEQFAAIRADADEFRAIRERLDLPDQPDYSEEQKIAVFRQHRLLTIPVTMTEAGDRFDYTLRVGENEGERITGGITTSGIISVTGREPSFNTCPICLAEGTLIDTPDGPVPVEDLREGMPVWTFDAEGNPVEGIVEEVARTPVPAGFQLVEIILADGRSVRASPGHPAADGRAIAEYAAGDEMDGSAVAGVRLVDYTGFTYDILPSGETGLYRADRILLKSTLGR